MMEVWKNIKGSEYEVSNLGHVYSHKSNRILKPWLTNGYPYVRIKISGQSWKKPIHRLVAEAFISNPHNKPCIDHINTITTDNRVENLRWVTYKENSRNPITIERLHQTTFKAGSENPKTMTGKFGVLNPVSRPVVQMQGGEVIAHHDCARRAMFTTGIDCGSITKCCRGQRKSAGGFIWMYKEDLI